MRSEGETNRSSRCFFSDDSSDLKTGKFKITMEIFLSSVVDTLNFELPKERNFLKIRTLQSEIQRLNFQRMNGISINIVSPSITLLEKTHVERAGSVLNGNMFINVQTWYQQ